MKDQDTLNLHGTDDKGNPVIIPLYEDDQVTPSLNARNIVRLLKVMKYPEPPNLPRELGGLQHIGG
jgi:hypothetical protein